MALGDAAGRPQVRRATRIRHAARASSAEAGVLHAQAGAGLHSCCCGSPGGESHFLRLLACQGLPSAARGAHTPSHAAPPSSEPERRVPQSLSCLGLCGLPFCHRALSGAHVTGSGPCRYLGMWVTLPQNNTATDRQGAIVTVPGSGLVQGVLGTTGRAPSAPVVGERDGKRDHWAPPALCCGVPWGTGLGSPGSGCGQTWLEARAPEHASICRERRRNQREGLEEGQAGGPRRPGSLDIGATQWPMRMVTVTVEIASGCPRKEARAPSI